MGRLKVQKGMTVYHKRMYTWGRGTVLEQKEISTWDLMSGQRPKPRAVVLFAGLGTERVVFVEDLRMTPDKKGIQEVVAWCGRRGKKAEVDNGQLTIQE